MNLSLYSIIDYFVPNQFIIQIPCKCFSCERNIGFFLLENKIYFFVNLINKFLMFFVNKKIYFITVDGSKDAVEF